MSRTPSRGRNSTPTLPDSTVGILGPAAFPSDSEDFTSATVPTSASATTTRRSRRYGTTQAPHNLVLPSGDRARSREPSPVQLWHTSPGIMDEGTDDEADNVHFMLKKSIDPSKFVHLFCIKPKLNSTNYAIWTDAMLRTLQTVSLHTYLDPDFTIPTSDTEDTKHHAVRWRKANLFVCSVLTAAMTEEKQHEIGHLPTAAEIWMEAHRLYMGSTATDWTLTIMALVTTRYNDGEDATAHITKMKTYRRDLLFMQRDIDDELFACFLRICIYAVELELCICSLAGALYIS